jgi:hypothetical protein
VEAMNVLGSAKNLKLFADLNIMGHRETLARRDVILPDPETLNLET